MRVTAVYVCPVFGGAFDQYAARFVESYIAHPPDLPHELFVVSNGGPPTNYLRALFAPTKNEWYEHNNSGYDIGAYQAISKSVYCDMMVCFGSSTYFKRAGWLRRMAEVFEHMGRSNLYGATGCLAPTPHVRTTAFWFRPPLLYSYPLEARSYQDRYFFEHGHQSFTWWAGQMGGEPFIVNWSGVRPLGMCNGVPNGYHNGDQSELLAYDRCTELHCA